MCIRDSIPSFVKMDFSDLPALLGAFALGPVYGVVISFMKNLLHIVIKGTSTACVGCLLYTSLCGRNIAPMWSAFETYQKEEEAQEAAEVQLDKAANE